MKTWLQFLLEKTEHEYSSTQVNLPLKLSSKLLLWGRQFVDKEDLQEEGLEDEPHVTVLFGLHANEPDEVKKVLKDESPVHMKLGKTSIFETEDCDVVKLSVESEDLVRLNKKLRENCEHTMTHPNYSPHCTIAYVKKGKGKKYTENAKFDGINVTIDTILFSNKNRIKTPIHLIEEKR